MANSKQNASAPVEETLNQSEAFFLKYKNVIMGCVLALVVIVAGVMLYKNYVSGPAELNASTAIAKGQDYFSRQQFELALNGDSTGYAGFAKIASEHSSTAAGNLANLYAGLCCANLDKWQEAAAKADNNSLSPTFLIQAGEILESQNKKDEALKLYQEVKDKYFNSMAYQTIDAYIERASAK